MENLKHSLDLLRDTVNYNQWIYSFLKPWLGDSVLEVGSGTGNITRFLLDCRRVICLEPEQAFNGHFSELVRENKNFHLVESSIEDFSVHDMIPEEVDTVICINVLEHIENDLGAVRKMLRFLKPQGKLLLYVPACQWAYGAMDRNMGHHRRYSRAVLSRISREAGARILECRAVNFVGLLGWCFSGRVLRESSIDVHKARIMDRLVPFVSSVERIVPPPVGQSLFAVLEKDGSPQLN